MYEIILFTLAGFGILFLLFIYGMLQAILGGHSANDQQRESNAPHPLLLLPLLLIIWFFQDTG